VVDKLGDRAGRQNIAVTCFYFDYAARKEQSVTSMMGSLVKQAVSGMENIPEEVSRVFHEQKMVIGGRGPRLPDIVKMLQAITSSRRTFVCIDALDECSAENRVKLLSSLKQILEKSPRTRIIIIGRPHVRDEVEMRLAGRVISVSLGPTKEDIIEYLRIRLEGDQTPDAMDENLAADILEKIPQNIPEMYVGAMAPGIPPTLSANKYASRFLLVSLNIDAILHESTISRRREKLSKTTDGLELGDVYGVTIERIREQDGDRSTFGMEALMWISHAERPLQANELCHALAVQPGSIDFDAGNIPSMSTLVSCCQGLITVDKEASTVRLIHFTLQEYLSSHPDIFSGPHSAMAEICLTYLNSRQVKALSTARSPDTQNAPFLEYCSAYWGAHAKRELSECARLLALELLKENYNKIQTKLLLAQVKYMYLDDLDIFHSFSGLHCASFFGIGEVVATLIEMEYYDINGEDFLGRTPLAWAAQNGHEGVVETLLGREEVKPEKPDKYSRTPLLFAAQNGHEGVVRILLGREEVNPDKADNYGQTPLIDAARNGHEGVVEILLGRKEVNPDKPDSYGQTPLSHAAWHGHEGLLKILLGREGVSPDKPDDDGRTPLSFAASRGHEGVVKLLLGREEVNPDKLGNSGRTPLQYAAQCGHEGVVKVLLGREEVDPEKPDNSGQTPLSFAALYGREGVVKILLGRKEVNPNQPDNDCQTPLWYAAQCGHERVVALLQSRKVVTPSTIEGLGDTT